jgi:RNA polymerase sigma-54 factor
VSICYGRSNSSLTTDLVDILGSIGEEAQVSEDEIKQVLSKVQRLDPVGIGARSLSECILLQLRQLDPGTPGLELAKSMAESHLDLIANQEYAELRRRHRASEEDLDTALALVKSSNPKPGLAVSPESTEYVVPDVFVRKIDNRWQVEISSSGIPRLSVNQKYAQLPEVCATVARKRRPRCSPISAAGGPLACAKP